MAREAKRRPVKQSVQSKGRSVTNQFVFNAYHNGNFEVYVGRPSKWSNPYLIDEPEVMREDVIRMHHEWLLKSELIHDLHELTGKTLGCWCSPLPCHADTLARMANNPFVIKAYSRV